jgi:hypothetical protein
MVTPLLIELSRRPWTQVLSLALTLGLLKTTIIAGLVAFASAVTAEVYPVVGNVAVDGAAPTGAVVRLNPLVTGRWVAVAPTGVVESDGSFRIRTLGYRDGAPAGKYAVTIQWQPPQVTDTGVVRGANVLPDSYASIRTTPLEAVVVAGSNELSAFALDCCCRDLLSVVSRK